MARAPRKKGTKNSVTQRVDDGPAHKNNPASRIPKSMVIRMGGNEIGPSASQLVRDMREVMEPHTASRLQERKSNRLRDYTSMVGPLGVSHLLLFYRAKESGNINLKIAVTPRGPTLSFRVERYSLAKDLAKAQRRPKTGNAGLDHLHPPLLVLNNFTSSQGSSEPNTTSESDSTKNAIPKQLESLTTSIFQSLFPPISPQQTPLASVRRVMLVDREQVPTDDPNSYKIHLRHYAITTRPLSSPNLSRGLKRLDRAKARMQHRPHAGAGLSGETLTTSDNRVKRKASKGALPDLSKLNDVADYLLEPGATGGYMSASESEAEGTDAEVEVVEEPEARKTWTRKEREDFLRRKEAQRQEQNMEQTGPMEEKPTKKSTSSAGRTHKRAVKLTELGPRLTLRLYKVEEGLCNGKVMWHEIIAKTKDEEKALEETWRVKNAEKAKRRREQRENLEQKKKAKEVQHTKDKGTSTNSTNKTDRENERQSTVGNLDMDEIEDEMEVDEFEDLDENE